MTTAMKRIPRSLLRLLQRTTIAITTTTALQGYWFAMLLGYCCGLLPLGRWAAGPLGRWAAGPLGCLAPKLLEAARLQVGYSHHCH